MAAGQTRVNREAGPSSWLGARPGSSLRSHLIDFVTVRISDSESPTFQPSSSLSSCRTTQASYLPELALHRLHTISPRILHRVSLTRLDHGSGRVQFWRVEVRAVLRRQGRSRGHHRRCRRPSLSLTRTPLIARMPRAVARLPQPTSSPPSSSTRQETTSPPETRVGVSSCLSGMRWCAAIRLVCLT